MKLLFSLTLSCDNWIKVAEVDVVNNLTCHFGDIGIYQKFITVDV